jgi:hypothetical protein
MSCAATETYTTAEPERFNREPVEDEISVRTRVVPEATYDPVPISHAVPSSMTYRMRSLFTAPASAKL